MYYAEVDENGRCFHVTNDKLPLSDTIIEVKNIDVLGMIWNGTDWKQESKSEEMISLPTQLDRIESTLAILTADTVTEESIYTAMQEGVNEV